MESSEKLNLALKYLEHQRDLYKSFWITATSLFGLIVIGSSLALLSGEVPEEYFLILFEIVLLAVPFTLIILLELFLRFFECNALFKKITIFYSNTGTEFENIEFEQLIDLIELNIAFMKPDMSKINSNYMDSHGWRISTKYRWIVSIILAVVINSLILFIQFSIQIIDSGTGSVILLWLLAAILIGLIATRLLIHRYVNSLIRIWPDGKYWK
ncbi:MAG: hypothetical protein ACXADY_25285 [Candidatus Hodarchaeales archaeon]